MSFYALFSTSLFLTMLPGALLSGIFFNLPQEVIRYAFGGALCGAICNAGMMFGYKYSDISLAYPAARALPVFFTMATTGIFGLGKPLSAVAVTGMLIIFSGCIAMAFSNGDKNKSPLQKILSIKKGLIGIFIASFATTGYTIIDSYGVREILSAFPGNNRFFVTCSYSCIRELLAMILMWTCVLIRRQAGTESPLSCRCFCSSGIRPDSACNEQRYQCQFRPGFPSVESPRQRPAGSLDTQRKNHSVPLVRSGDDHVRTDVKFALTSKEPPAKKYHLLNKAQRTGEFKFVTVRR